ncbi:MAG TPA: hypothetical protein VH475_13495 [Tepidisphaeraceae bacterium]
MAHRLFPITEGAYLAPKEIVRRLRAEFDFVETDADAGTEHVEGMLAQFQRMNAPPAVIEAHRAALGKAVRIVVSDREDYDDDYLAFTTWPNNDPLVGYSSRQHEGAAAPLLERACKILRYRAELV